MVTTVGGGKVLGVILAGFGLVLLLEEALSVSGAVAVAEADALVPARGFTDAPLLHPARAAAARAQRIKV
jgi:hypothetical protein